MKETELTFALMLLAGFAAGWLLADLIQGIIIITIMALVALGA
jgi:hypothetical protein